MIIDHLLAPRAANNNNSNNKNNNNNKTNKNHLFKNSKSNKLPPFQLLFPAPAQNICSTPESLYYLVLSSMNFLSPNFLLNFPEFP